MKKGKDYRKIVVLQFTLLRGENDSKQSGEIQARVSLTLQNLLLTWITHCDLISQWGISIGQSVEKD